MTTAADLNVPTDCGRKGEPVFSPTKQYLVCEDWGHIFSERYGEETTRWVFDRAKRRIVALDVWDEGAQKWVHAPEHEVGDVEDSDIFYDADALDPEEWEFLVTSVLPEWALR